jgi:hypothetical protein
MGKELFISHLEQKNGLNKNRVYVLTLWQCCGSALVSMQIRIRIQHFLSMGIRIQGFDVQKLEKIYN